jgi:hypothetical protein
MLILRSDYELLGLDPTYDVYGEDVDLCLRVRGQLYKDIWCCVGLTGIHEASTTRRLVGTENANAKDSNKIIREYLHFKSICDRSELILEFEVSQMEVRVLREVILTMQSLDPSQESLVNFLLSPAITVARVDAGDEEEKPIGDDIHITTQLRHERLDEILDSVIASTGDICELRMLSLQIYQILTDVQLASPNPPMPLLDILYNHWASLVNK